LQEWGKRVLDPDARLILRVVPESDTPDVNPRDSRPAAAAETNFKLPPSSSFTLSNGIRVFYFNRPQLPLMTVSTLFKGGAQSDPAKKLGLASITADMLSQGAGSLDAEGFSKALESLGASFGASAGDASTTVSLSSTAESFEKALPLYASAIENPHLAAPDFERQRTLALDALADDADDPETASRFVALREFFGPASPFGRNPAGTSDTLKAIEPADLRQEHDALFRPDRAALFVAGSLPAEVVQKDLDREFGAWAPSTGVPPLAEPKAEARAVKGPRFVIVDRPQAVQTVIRFIFPGVPYGNPDRIALEGLATVLGGTFTSRLNADLREDKGYTYGAGSHDVFEPQVGYMTAESSVRANVTGLSLQEFLSQFARLRTGDIGTAEAVKARQSMRTDQILALESLSGLIASAQQLFENGRSFQDLTQDLATMSTLGAARLNVLAKSAAPLDKAVIVLIGDKDLILAQIAGLKLPKPEIVPGMR
ncbi:MAG TPA: pitrilysin family protein, partial [Fimbriimonadaceae bacterium]|nr:pitrilysin family protein [Fimbriimonadaceae bacterium]